MSAGGSIIGWESVVIEFLHKLEVYFGLHPHCPFSKGHHPALTYSTEHNMLFSTYSAELGRKYSQSCSQVKSTSSFCCGGFKKPQLADKDLLHVCGGSLGREMIITWQEMLWMTCFPGNLAALQVKIWIRAKLLKALIPLIVASLLFPLPAPTGAVLSRIGSILCSCRFWRSHAVSRGKEDIATQCGLSPVWAACCDEQEDWDAGKRLLSSLGSITWHGLILWGLKHYM